MSAKQDLSKAKSLLKKGQANQARLLFQRILQKYPANKDAAEGLAAVRATPQDRSRVKLLRQAEAHFGEKKITHALQTLETYQRNFSQDPESLYLQGVMLGRMHRYSAAITAYRTALKLVPGEERVMLNLAETLLLAGRYDQGISTLRAMLDQSPSNASLWGRLALALRNTGDKSGAVEAGERAAELAPDNVSFLCNLVQLKSITPDDPESAEVARLIGDPKTDKKHLRQLHAAMAKVFDKAKDPATAFDHYAKSNAAARATYEFDINQTKAEFTDFKASFATLPTSDDLATDAPHPIFVVGMPRSGTTLLEQILGGHDDVTGAGELRWFTQTTSRYQRNLKGAPFPGDILQEIRSLYQEVLTEMSQGKTYVVDKMPLNFQYVGVMAAAFPEAPILNTQRDPRATCWSIFTQSFSTEGNRYANDLGEVAEFYTLYQDLMAFWKELLPGRILDVPYEALTEDPETEAKRVFEFCGLSWSPEVLGFHNQENRLVTTASVDQVRQSIYTGSSDKWRAYAPFIGDAFDPIGGVE